MESISGSIHVGLVDIDGDILDHDWNRKAAAMQSGMSERP